jgi:hypothetical protein
MTSYSVPSGAFSISETLTANSVDTISFADRGNYISVTNIGTTVLFARADGTAATVAGEGTYPVLPGSSTILANGLPLWYQSSRVLIDGSNNAAGQSRAGQMANPGSTVSLVSSASVAYSVSFAG